MGEISIRPWAEGEMPTEVEIRGILDEEGLQPYRWSNAPGDVYAAHTHPFHRMLESCCFSGRRLEARSNIGKTKRGE